jgi:hypothetical protein
MLVTKFEIEQELKEEVSYKNLSPKEREMLLLYLTNGMDELEAYKDVYMSEESEKVVKFPGKVAAKIVAKPDFQDCIALYGDFLNMYASSRTNVHLYNMYVALATYSILDFVDEYGAFKFNSIQEAKDQLGIKASAITGFNVTMHPKDPEKIMTVPILADRMKAMKELSKFSKFLGEMSESEQGLSNITVNTSLATISIEDDERRRRELRLVNGKE